MTGKFLIVVFMASLVGRVTADQVVKEKLADGMRVSFVLKPTAKSNIRCEMFLPSADRWDGRLWGFGNGSWGGSVFLQRCGNSATVQSDMGTKEWPQSMNVVPQEIRDDFGWRATHLMTVEAKRIIREHYGRGAHHAYFTGSSTGGGQGFCEAQRYPDDYDGIYAGVPAFDRVSLATPEVRRERLKKRYGKWFTPAEEDAVYAAELAYFAKSDPEVARGRFIMEPRITSEKLDGCWAEIVKRNPSLADREQPWRALFEPFYAGGRRLAPGAQLGCEFRGASDFLLRKLPQVGDKPYGEITDDDLCAFANDTTHNFKDIGAMKRYFRRGGKMLIDAALEDTSVPERAITEFIDALGPDEGYLYFRIPGRTHIGSPTQPHRGRLSKSGWIRNVTGLMQDWVEKGIRPSSVTVPLYDCKEMQLVLKPYGSVATASAAAATATVAVDPSKVLAVVPRTLYGTGMEDVNHEICGGLDAQRLYDESFEEQEIEPVAGKGICPKPTWVCGRQWKVSTTADGRVTADRRDPHLGAVAVALEPGKGTAAVANAGLNGWGVPCRKGRRMQGRFFAKGKVGGLSVSLRRRSDALVYASSPLVLQKAEGWQRLDFTLTPSANDPAAEFVITAADGGRLLVDDAYLADEPTNEFGRLGCREDVVDGFRREGLTFLRWGGAMANSWGYLWKNMAGDRRPYDGFWFRTSSTGFLYKEFVRMANAMKLPCAFAVFAYEQVAKAAEIAGWLKQFDGEIYVQIGNEECAGITPPSGECTLGDCRRYCESLRLIVSEMRKVNPRLKFVSGLYYLRDRQDVMDEGFRLTDGYVDYWDLHLPMYEQDVTKVVKAARQEFGAFRDMVRRLNPQTKMKVAVFEENGFEHGLRRALAHAAVLGVCREQGDFLLTSCPANALQPYRQNENGWDQGQIFLTPDKVWLQPCGWAQQMASSNHRDLLIDGTSSDPQVLLSATKDRAGRSLVLHVVNSSTATKPVSLSFADGVSRKVVRVTALTGDGPLAENTPEAMQRVVPQDMTEEFLRTSVLPPYSYVVMELTDGRK